MDSVVLLKVFPAVAALLLSRSAIGKIVRFDEFRLAVAAYEPRIDDRSVASAWVSLEALAAVALLVPYDWRYLPAAVVVGLATGAVARRLTQEATHDCGCGRRSHQIGWRILVRNASLLVAAAVLTLTTANGGTARTLTIAVGVSAAIGFILVGSRRNELDTPADIVRRENHHPVIERVTGF